MPPRVFVCYARVDQAFALPLAEQLKARSIDVWIDQAENQVSDDWDRDIDRALRDCSHLLIVLSPASVESREVRGELRTALDLGKPVLPVLYQACEIPRQLRVVQFVDFTKRTVSDELALSQLLRALQPGGGHGVNPLGPPGPMPVPPPSAPRSAARPSATRPRLPALNARTKGLLAAALAVVLAGAAWFGLDMAMEERRRLNDAALSPDGRYLATATGQGLGVRGAVRVWDVGTGRESGFIKIDGPAWLSAWSPDGSRLAVGDHSGTIHIYNSGTWQRAQALTGPHEYTRMIAWSPDGKAVATGDSNGWLWVWESGTGALRFSKGVNSSGIDEVAWAPDGGRLATGSADDSVAVVDASNGSLMQRLEGHVSDVETVAFSPDGTLLASGSLGAPYLIVWDSRGARHDLEGHRGPVKRVAWSRDGRYLASADGSLVAMWDVARLALARRFPLSGRFNSGTGLAWSPDGSRLAAGDGENVQILDPARDVPVSTLPERSGSFYDSIEMAGWSADGKRLGTFTKFDRTSGVWDVDRATRLQSFSVGLWRSLIE